MNQVGQAEIVRQAPLVTAAAIGVACSATALPFYAIGSLTKPLVDAHGWSRSDVQTAVLFSIGLGAVMSPLVGAAVERFGARRVAMSGLIGVAAGFFLAAVSGASLAIFYVAFAGMAVIGAGSNPVSWTRGIAASFRKQRGLALGLVLTGTGICAIVIPQVTTWAIRAFGVSTALAGLGLLPLLVALPLVAACFRPRDQGIDIARSSLPDATGGITLRQAAAGYRFWVMLASISAIYLAQAGIIANLIPAITDRGFTAQQAANVQSILGISIIVGRIAVGWLVDRYWAPGVAAAVTFLPVIACLIIPSQTGYGVIATAAVLIGLAAGAELDLLAFLAARYFGLRHYARIYAYFYAALAIFGGCAPLAFARVHDAFDSYDLAFYAGAGLFAFGSLIMLTLGRYPDFRLQHPHDLQQSSRDAQQAVAPHDAAPI